LTSCVWKLSEMPEEARARSKIISDALGIPSLVADLMVQRGIENTSDAEAFLRADLMDLEDPNLLKDMEKAVERIIRGMEENEKIVVYGDYDGGRHYVHMRPRGCSRKSWSKRRLLYT